jgi:hypothetical protein
VAYASRSRRSFLVEILNKSAALWAVATVGAAAATLPGCCGTGHKDEPADPAPDPGLAAKYGGPEPDPQPTPDPVPAEKYGGLPDEPEAPPEPATKYGGPFRKN